MDHDDRPLGKILNRREALKILGLSSLGVLAGCVPGSTQSQATGNEEAQSQVETAAVPVCVVRPELTEGPYYVDEGLDRSDIRSDPGSGEVKAGALLKLSIYVSRIGSGGGCTPLPGAKVDIWHCDAEGVYSDVSDRSFNTQGQKFLRGYQVTDENGRVMFTTIYPGWYPGRTVHIHFKVQPTENQVFTSQLFFEDKLSDQVFTQQPYAGRGQRNTLNSQDSIFQQELMLDVTQDKDGNFETRFDIGMQF